MAQSTFASVPTGAPTSSSGCTCALMPRAKATSMKMIGSSGSCGWKKAKQRRSDSRRRRRSRQPWIACTASYWISFSSTRAEVRQSMRSRRRKPRLNQERSRCIRSRSMARQCGCVSSPVSSRLRISTSAAVPPEAMLSRRNSSWRAGSTLFCRRSRFSGVGSAWSAAAARLTASAEGEYCRARASKNASRWRSSRPWYATSASRASDALAYSPRSLSSASHSESRFWVGRSTPSCLPPSSRRKKDIALIHRSGGGRGPRLSDQARGFLAGDPVEVVAVLEQHAQGVVDGFWIERNAVERHQAVGPVDRLGDPRQLEQIALSQPLHESDHFPGQRLARFRRLAVQNLELARRVREVHPVVEAAPLHRVVDLARAVGGDDHDRRLGGAQRADLGNRDLPVRQHLEQVGLEGLVGPVELVDEQDRRIAFQRARQRPFNQEFLGVNIGRELLLRLLPRCFGQPDFDHLPRVVPLVGSLRDVQTLVALQADELPAQALGDDLADLGLAARRLAFQEQRPAHGEGEEKRGGEAAIGDVVARSEELLRLVDGVRKRACHGQLALYFNAASTARLAMTVIRCARYSGLACRSLLRPSAFTLMLATDSGANFEASAFSMSVWRNAQGPAPVTPTRTLPPKSATNTPTMAKRDAGFLNFM